MSTRYCTHLIMKSISRSVVSAASQQTYSAALVTELGKPLEVQRLPSVTEVPDGHVGLVSNIPACFTFFYRGHDYAILRFVSMLRNIRLTMSYSIPTYCFTGARGCSLFWLELC